MKLVKKTELSEMELNKFLPREIAIFQKISHPNILNVYPIVCQTVAVVIKMENKNGL